MTLRSSPLIAFLLSFPVLYFLISYAYVAYWHGRLSLWNVIVHENGRLTLLGTMFYFDHFVGCVPMIALFALCTAGGFGLFGHVPSRTEVPQARVLAVTLLLSVVFFVVVALTLSVYSVGWQRTLDYALQRIERDGVTSKGGNWNQLQLSNIPIALGAIALAGALLKSGANPNSGARRTPHLGGLVAIAVAVLLSIGITAFNWCGWASFLNPRWLAHSIREVATYPLTGIPIALTGVLLVEVYLSRSSTFRVVPRPQTIVFVAVGVAIVVGQLLLVRNVNVLSIAQRPSFASDGLSIPYLLSSHVFEHFLDFVVIGPLAGGFYALVRMLNCRA